MENAVPKNIRTKRSKLLRGLSVKKRRAFYESQLGSVRTVLFEGENKSGYIHGFTENYVKVKTPWNPTLVNTLHEVELTKIDSDGKFATLTGFWDSGTLSDTKILSGQFNDQVGPKFLKGVSGLEPGEWTKATAENPSQEV